MTDKIRPPHAELMTVDAGGVPVSIWRQRTRDRIVGLAWEDTVRSVSIYPEYRMPASITGPVDILPEFDDLQGLPTHVKSMRVPRDSRTRSGHWTGSIDMACSYQLLLHGLDRAHPHHRLVVGLYDYEDYTIDGKETRILCYHTVIEVIQSPTTFAAYRGGVDIEDVRRLREDCSNFTDLVEIPQDVIDAARERFHPITAAWRDSGAMGIARISNKIDKSQIRPQSQISLKSLRLQMEGEPDYRGRQVQPNWQEYTTDFYGLPLPYRTTGKDEVFDRRKDADAKPKVRRRRAKDQPIVAPVDPDARYLAAHLKRRDHDVPGGRFATVPVGDEGIIKAIHGDDAFRKSVSRACIAAGGGRWIERGRLWVLPRENANEAWRTLMRSAATTGRGPVPLPDPDPSVMTRIKNNLYEVVSLSGIIVRLLRLPRTNWVLRPDDGRGTPDPADTNRRSVAIIEAICDRHHVGEWEAAHQNMLVKQEPPELIQRIARAIADHDDRI
jgi:hypothetical protein